MVMLDEVARSLRQANFMLLRKTDVKTVHYQRVLIKETPSKEIPEP